MGLHVFPIPIPPSHLPLHPLPLGLPSVFSFYLGKIQINNPFKNDSLEKTLMLGKTGQEKGATEDEMVGWHHRLNGLEFEQAL